MEGSDDRPKRKPISKHVRFEVFKRDEFTCQYCGAHPPGVLLHVDHIVAVAAGGTNVIDNLVTSCEPCNAGKGARSLGAVPASMTQKADVIREREEQIRGYQEVVEARAMRLEQEVQRVVDVYERFNPEWTLSERSRISVRSFIEKLGVHPVVAAMEKACAWKTGNQQFKYFCGICWHTIRGD